MDGRVFCYLAPEVIWETHGLPKACFATFPVNVRVVEVSCRTRVFEHNASHNLSKKALSTKCPGSDSQQQTLSTRFLLLPWTLILTSRLPACSCCSSEMAPHTQSIDIESKLSSLLPSSPVPSEKPVTIQLHSGAAHGIHPSKLQWRQVRDIFHAPKGLVTHPICCSCFMQCCRHFSRAADHVSFVENHPLIFWRCFTDVKSCNILVVTPVMEWCINETGLSVSSVLFVSPTAATQRLHLTLRFCVKPYGDKAFTFESLVTGMWESYSILVILEFCNKWFCWIYLVRHTCSELT